MLSNKTKAPVEPRRRSRAIWAVVVLAAVLQMAALGRQSFNGDEGYTIHRAGLALPALIDDTARAGHAPLYFILIHVWMPLFGRSEVALRAPSVLFGVLAVLMIYRVGVALFDERTGLVGALLLTLSIFHLFHAQSARMYTLVALLTLLSMHFFIRLYAEAGWPSRLGYVLATAALAYTHGYALTAVVAQNVFFFFSPRASGRRRRPRAMVWLLLQGLVAALYAPWFPIMLGQAAATVGSPWLHLQTSPWLASARTLGVFAQYSVVCLALYLALSARALVSWRRSAGAGAPKRHGLALRPAIGWSESLALVWLSAPLVFPLLISLFFPTPYLHRIAIGAAPAFYLLVAHGFTRLRFPRLKGVVLVAILTLSALSLRHYFVHLRKIPWRDVARYVQANAGPRDMVLFADLAPMGKRVFELYVSRPHLAVRLFPAAENRPARPPARWPDTLLQGRPTIWLISSRSGTYSPFATRGIVRILRHASYELREKRTYASADLGRRPQTAIVLQVFERRPPPSFRSGG